MQEAIAECQGKRDPDASTCIKLAAFYTIRREMFGAQEKAIPSYSFAPGQADDGSVIYAGDSEFAEKVNGRRQEDVWPIMDELMDAVRVLYPKLYYTVLDKL